MKNVYCVMADERVCHVVRKEHVVSAVDAWKGIYKNARAVPAKDVIDTSKTIVEQVQQLFEKMNCPYEIWEQDGNICISIYWGDWKHDHENADYVMETAFGYRSADETVTEENGSDTYSAVHTYVPAF